MSKMKILVILLGMMMIGCGGATDTANENNKSTDINNSIPTPTTPTNQPLAGTPNTPIVNTPTTPTPIVGTQYFVSTTGDDNSGGLSKTDAFATVNYAISKASATDVIIILSGEYHQDITVDNFTGPLTIKAETPPNMQTPKNSGGAIFSPNGSLAKDGLVSIYNSTKITISGLEVKDVTKNNDDIGLYIENSQNIIFENKLIQNIKSSGIGVWSKKAGRGNPIGGTTDVIIRGNRLINVTDGGNNEIISVAGVDRFLVYNNNIYNTRATNDGKGGEGIDIKQGSKNGKVYNNYIHDKLTTDTDMKRTCIYVDAYNFDTYNIEIFNNTITECGASGIVLADEVGGVGALENVIVHNNLIYNNDTEAGIKRVAIEVTGDNGDGSTKSIRNIAILNNTVYNSLGGIFIKDNSASNTFANIMVQNNAIEKVTSFNVATKNLQSSTNKNIDVVKVYKNVYEKEATGIDSWGGGYTRYDFSTTDEAGVAIAVANQKKIEPNLLNSPLSNDFKLNSSSKAIDYGSSKSTIIAIFKTFSTTIASNTTDLLSKDLTVYNITVPSFSTNFDKDYNSSNRGSLIDVGAYEM